MELGPTALIRISTSVSARRLGLSLFHNRRLARNFVLPTLTNSADFLDRTNHRNSRLVRISHPFCGRIVRYFARISFHCQLPGFLFPLATRS